MKFLLVALAFAAAFAYRRQYGSRWQCDGSPVGVNPDSENPEDRLKGVGAATAAAMGIETEIEVPPPPSTPSDRVPPAA